MLRREDSGRAAGCGSACGMSCKKAVQHLTGGPSVSWVKGGGEKGQQCTETGVILRNVRIVLRMRRNHQTQIRAGAEGVVLAFGAVPQLATGDRRQASLEFGGSGTAGGEARQGKAGIGASCPVSKPEGPHGPMLATDADITWDGCAVNSLG
jgi:hypothetical protein